MKKNLSKVIALTLLAVAGVQTVDAQSQVANNRRERILAPMRMFQQPSSCISRTSWAVRLLRITRLSTRPPIWTL